MESCIHVSSSLSLSLLGIPTCWAGPPPPPAQPGQVTYRIHHARGLYADKRVRLVNFTIFGGYFEFSVSFLADEEIGGHGMGPLVNMQEFKDLNVGFALDEGMVCFWLFYPTCHLRLGVSPNEMWQGWTRSF